MDVSIQRLLSSRTTLPETVKANIWSQGPQIESATALSLPLKKKKSFQSRFRPFSCSKRRMSYFLRINQRLTAVCLWTRKWFSDRDPVCSHTNHNLLCVFLPHIVISFKGSIPDGLVRASDTCCKHELWSGQITWTPRQNNSSRSQCRQ